MKKRQLNVTVSPITLEQVHEIQGWTGESQAVLIVRLVAEEHARLEKRVRNFDENDVPKD